jgi:membrane protein required for colicin V production
MSILDALIILFILFYAFLGFKRGFTKELVSFVGFFAIVIIAFLLKNPISQILYERMPFFSFGGLFKGVTALNIVLYEIIAFFIVVFFATIIFKVLLFATTIFEKLLSVTVILGIPSKILGMIVGVIEGFVWCFILLYILSLPIFSSKEIQESKLKGPILENTPILSTFTKDMKQALDEFSILKEKYEVEENTEEFNYSTMEILLKYKIISVDSASKLEEKGKLKIENIDILLNQYKE